MKYCSALKYVFVWLFIDQILQVLKNLLDLIKFVEAISEISRGHKDRYYSKKGYSGTRGHETWRSVKKLWSKIYPNQYLSFRTVTNVWTKEYENVSFPWVKGYHFYFLGRIFIFEFNSKKCGIYARGICDFFFWCTEKIKIISFPGKITFLYIFLIRLFIKSIHTKILGKVAVNKLLQPIYY